MDHLEGAVQALTGYSAADMIGNRKVSWVGITSPHDKDRVFAEVDAAIEANTSWDTAYRIISRTGDEVWVRERGNAVFEGGELAYLQGLIVSAAAERELSAQLEDTAERTKAANHDIIKLSGQIAQSVKQLSMLIARHAMVMMQRAKTASPQHLYMTSISRLITPTWPSISPCSAVCPSIIGRSGTCRRSRKCLARMSTRSSPMSARCRPRTVFNSKNIRCSRGALKGRACGQIAKDRRQ